MTLKLKFKSLFCSDWFIGLILLGVFFISTSYKYGWDDQHLEIPLLKHLIDPGLYQGDYYVESLQKNFSSYFYPLLAKLITVTQIPQTYFILYILSRYFLFFFSYKIWRCISHNRYQAFMCVLSFILLVRVDEFLYRTFSHQEFAFAIIFAGIYYFFKERFIFAAIILGIAANFHALYSLFPMMFMGLYLLWQVKKHGMKTLVISSASFLLFASPFILWTFQNRFGQTLTATVNPPLEEWTRLYNLACPQNFFLHFGTPLKELLSKFQLFFNLTKVYWFLILLFILNLTHNELFQKNKKALTFCLGAFGFLILCFFFTYLYPSRFFLDLNIIRNTQYLLFLLMGFTTILFINKTEKHHVLIGIALGCIFAFLKYDASIALAGIILALLILTALKLLTQPNTIAAKLLGGVIALLSFPVMGFIYYQFTTIPYRPQVLNYLLIIFSLFVLAAVLCLIFKKHTFLKQLFLIIPLCVFLCQFHQYKLKQVQLEKGETPTFWRVQKNWEEMQHYVKENTPTEAIIFVPYNMEMGGFRIGSERELVVSYRDCGIIGFDYNAAKEWDQRIQDVKEFNVRPNQNPGPAIKNAIVKYKADYIVFLKIAGPNKNVPGLTHTHRNPDFVLYKIQR